MRKTTLGLLALILSLGTLLAACSADGAQGKTKITLGYFPNMNHAATMVAIEKNYYQDILGDEVEVEFLTFPDGGKFMTALQSGDIQGGIVGPGPAMNHYLNGAKVQIIAASSTGGTVIMAREGSGIQTPEDISGRVFISPDVGCTHDVQFETYMKEIGITSNRIGGTMKHITGNPAQYQGMFESGQIDVSATPEPWASVLEESGKAYPIIEWNEVSFGETLPAAVYVTHSDLAQENPELVQKLIDAHQKATDYIAENPEQSKQIVIDSIKEITGQELSRSVVDKAWERTQFTTAIDAETLQAFADSSYDLKFPKIPEQPDMSGLINDSFLQY